MQLLLLLQVLIDATDRPELELAVVDLASGLPAAAAAASRPSVNSDMPLDAARQYVYAITATRVRELNEISEYHHYTTACDNWYTSP